MVWGYHLIFWVLLVIAFGIEIGLVLITYNVPTSATITTYITVREQQKRIALVMSRTIGDDGPCVETMTEEEYGPPRTVTRRVEVAVFAFPDFQEFIQGKNVLTDRYYEIVCSPLDDNTIFYVIKLHLNGDRRNVKRVWQYRGRMRGSLKFASNVISTAVCLPLVPLDLISGPITVIITQLADGVLSFLSEVIVFIVSGLYDTLKEIKNHE